MKSRLSACSTTPISFTSKKSTMTRTLFTSVSLLLYLSHNFELVSDQIVLVMELIEGEHLLSKICKQDNQTISEKLAANYISQLLSALNHCHANGVIHRDIKPENIMLTKNDKVRLIDFGLSRVCKNCKFSEIAGTPYYMSPEMISKEYNVKTDLWSVGVILYTLVSGYLPFQGKT